jgi:hydrogenase-4 component B
MLMVASMAAGLGAAFMRLLGSGDAIAAFPWQAAGDALVGLDALSAFFLIPVFLVGGLGSIYGLGYWPRGRYPRSARRLETFWGSLVAGLALLVIAKHALSFLLGWEAMALSAFFLVVTEDFRKESRRAGLVYLIATHIGTLVLFGFFVLWRHATGSFAFEALGRESMGGGAMNLLFLLALVVFGLKAGMMPLHFWLPGAHASAPSHVSAILSGVVLKMGIYGLLRFLLLVEAPPLFWGILILVAGGASSLFGVAFALGQHDLKRLLAYHSVENIGIILMGLGLAIVGRSTGNDLLLVLGLAGALLHVWNHSLFKSLLFLCAGSVLRSTHTRELDRLGGLSRSMPFTAAAFLVGAVAICGLPPLNGFVSELLLYLGLLGGLSAQGSGFALAALAVPVLAATGALAVACFVKVYGTAFLGLPRSAAARLAHEAPLAMRLSMLVLALACLFIGLAPALLAPLLDELIAPWRAGTAPALPGLLSLAPLKTLGILQSLLAATLALLVALPLLAVRRRGRTRALPAPGTWDCGYAAPTARMEYSSSSFAATIVGLFAWLLRPRTRQKAVEDCFPGPSGFATEVEDAVLDGVLGPAWRGIEGALSPFRRLQQGLTQNYILFILVTVMALLATLLPVKDIFARLFAR